MSDLIPKFECILKKPDGVRLAVFGVENSSSCVVDAPIGPSNGFGEGAVARGQPTQFLPGYSRAFMTQIAGTLTWQLGDRLATATEGGPACTHVGQIHDSPIIITAVKDHSDPASTTIGEKHIPEGQSFTLPKNLPVAVGNAANGEAVLRYTSDTGETVTCTYRGGASTSTPDSDLERARGRSYHFVSCDDGSSPGDELIGTGWWIDILGGDPRISQTVVKSHLGPGCSGLLEPPISHEDTVILRQGFDWSTTVAQPEVDSTGLPALRYALIYVESREQIAALEKMGIYHRHLPIFASELQRYAGKCGTVDNSGDLQGVFIHALVPAVVYNFWRDAALSVISNGAGEIPFRAVVLPPIPDMAMANVDGTVSWQSLKAAGFSYRNQRAAQQPLFGIDIPFIDDAIEVIGGALIAGPIGATIGAFVQVGDEVLETAISIMPTLDDIIEFSADLVEAVIEEVQVGLGTILEFATGSQRFPLDFDIMNRDPSFDSNRVIQRAWGRGVGGELSLNGAKVEIFQSLPLLGILTSHRGNMTSSGKVDIEVAGAPSIAGIEVADAPDLVGICVHMENDAAMISSGITENEQCTFADNFGLFLGDDLDVLKGPVPPGGRYVLTVNHSDANYLTQITDARAYAHDVMGLDPKQAEVSVGVVADTIGQIQGIPRAFVGCFDYSEMSHALLASELLLGSVLGGLGAAIVPGGAAVGGLGLFAHPFIAKDIFLPADTSIKGSRNTVTHEYGHFVMCDIVSEDLGQLLNLYTTRAVSEGLGETLSDPAGLAMESFADFFASQVSSGTNYFAADGANRGTYAGSFCFQSPCLEKNYRRVSSELPAITDEYRQELRRRVSLYHDAVDRDSSAWRSANIPGNADAWESVGSKIRINTSGSYLESVDEDVEMSGAGIANWISRSSGGDYSATRFEEGLVEQLYDEGHSWCQVCNLFALHDADVATTATMHDKWAACRDGLVIERLRQPPQADLRLSSATCEVCPAKHISDSQGVCTPCPGVRDVVVGNACVGCPQGEIAVADSCVPCANDEAVAGNQCVDCGPLHTANRLPTGDSCVACPVDQTIDLGTFSPGGICNDSVEDIGSLAGAAPGDICPNRFVLEVDNVNSLGTGQVMASDFYVSVRGQGPREGTNACVDTTAAIGLERLGVSVGGLPKSPAEMESSSAGVDCVERLGLTCTEDCQFSFSAEANQLIASSPAENANTQSLRFGFTVDPTAPLVSVSVSAADFCPLE